MYPQPVTDVVNAASAKIMAQREEILNAFIAKYGDEPDQCVQVVTVTDSQMTWSVKHRMYS